MIITLILLPGFLRVHELHLIPILKQMFAAIAFKLCVFAGMQASGSRSDATTYTGLSASEAHVWVELRYSECSTLQIIYYNPQ